MGDAVNGGRVDGWPLKLWVEAASETGDFLVDARRWNRCRLFTSLEVPDDINEILQDTGIIKYHFTIEHLYVSSQRWMRQLKQAALLDSMESVVYARRSCFVSLPKAAISNRCHQDGAGQEETPFPSPHVLFGARSTADLRGIESSFSASP